MCLDPIGSLDDETRRELAECLLRHLFGSWPATCVRNKGCFHLRCVRQTPNKIGVRVPDIQLETWKGYVIPATYFFRQDM